MKGVFGYTYMSSFINALGINIALLCSALFLKFSAKRGKSELQPAINFGANMFMYVACYFMINLFIPKKQLFGTPDFPPYYYWGSMLFLSVMAGKLLMLFEYAITYSEEKLKGLIRNMFRFLLSDLEDKDMIKPEKQKYYKEKRVELVKEALDLE